MKRSEINQAIKDAMSLAKKMNFTLPPFAFWTPEEWAEKGHEYDEIRENMLGWDITDWSLGNFKDWGLTLFTVRNGNVYQDDNHKMYAEKMLVIEEGQKEPYHFHWKKVEDLINRGGGTLVMKIYYADEADDSLSDRDVRISVDGRNYMAPAGTEIRLQPGESMTVFERQYHMMWAEGGTVLASEISNVNDDKADNRFLEDIGRFPPVEEDEKPAYLLCTEYPAAK